MDKQRILSFNLLSGKVTKVTVIYTYHVAVVSKAVKIDRDQPRGDVHLWSDCNSFKCYTRILKMKVVQICTKFGKDWMEFVSLPLNSS